MKEKNEHREIRDELRDIAPGLKGMKREDGFTTPHNYFRELPDRVFAKIAEEQGKAAPTWSWLHNLLKPKYALALASVLALIVAGIWYTRMQSPQDPLATITQDEAIEYILNNLDEFSSDDLISAGVLVEWDAMELAPVTDEDLDEMMSDETLIEELF